MKVYTNGYGLVEFKPQEVYRFNNNPDNTQLRGSIKINKPDLSVTLGSGDDWIPLNYWFTSQEIEFENWYDDINAVAGLPIRTADEIVEDQFKDDFYNPAKCTCPLCSGIGAENKPDLNSKINNIIQQQIDLVADALSVTSSDDLVWDSAVTKQHSHLINTLGILKSMV